MKYLIILLFLFTVGIQGYNCYKFAEVKDAQIQLFDAQKQTIEYILMMFSMPVDEAHRK